MARRKRSHEGKKKQTDTLNKQNCKERRISRGDSSLSSSWSPPHHHQEHKSSGYIIYAQLNLLVFSPFFSSYIAVFLWVACCNATTTTGRVTSSFFICLLTWLTLLQKKEILYIFTQSLSLFVCIIFVFCSFPGFINVSSCMLPCFCTSPLFPSFLHFLFSTLGEWAGRIFLKKRKAERYLKYYESQNLHITQDSFSIICMHIAYPLLIIIITFPCCSRRRKNFLKA